jgi:CRP-like cAMP-binding protein
VQYAFQVTGERACTAARESQLVEGVLTHLPLFSGIALPQVQQVAAKSRVVHGRRGEVICARGELLPGVVAVAYGMLKLALRRADGEEKVVRFLGAGECFGEASVLLSQPSRVEAVALEESQLVVAPAPMLRRLVELDRRFAHNLVDTLAGRSLDLLAELEASVQQCGVQRLACLLESLAEPGRQAGRWVVRLPATKTAVAARLGVKKETLSRMLRGLAERGLIEVTGREVAILDRPGLARLATNA